MVELSVVVEESVSQAVETAVEGFQVLAAVVVAVLTAPAALHGQSVN